MTGRKARIGIIGTGWWATAAHLPGLSAHPDAEIVGLADLDINKAQQTAERFGVERVFSDHRELLALGLDGVIVVTPHHTHYGLVRDSLLAGADVLVEKPMVVEAAHARELLQIARERGRHLHVGYPYPHNRHSRLLRETVLRGDFGKIHLVSSIFATSPHNFYRGITDEEATPPGGAMWFPGTETYSQPERGGGNLLTQVTHAASLLFFVSGLEPRDVHAFTENYDTKVDLFEAINFRTATGAIGSIASSGTVPSTQKTIEEIRIFGSKAHAVHDSVRGTLTIFFADGSIEEVPTLSQSEKYPLQKTSQHLVDVILGRDEQLVSPELGVLTVEFLAAARESAETGKIVSIDAARAPEE